MSHFCPQCHAPVAGERLEGLCAACFFLSAGDVVGTGAPVRGREIARGGMGIVYEARQEEPARTVAMKMLQPRWSGHEEVRERFRREAQAMASLEHPAILPVYEVGETDGLPWFTMTLASGGSLAARISNFQGEWRKAAELMARLARALGFAHERGVLHRDLKPGNILFDAEERCYLADFGLAKHLDGEEGSGLLTLDAHVLGTPNYLAPELAAGTTRAATTASDIYSLGAVLYELLGGSPPHQDPHLTSLLRRVADETPPSLAACDPAPPRDLRAICEKAMSRDVDRRYATARELAEDLERFVRGEAVLARSAGIVESAWRACRRHPVAATLAGTVVLLLTLMAAGSMLAVMRISRAEREALAARDHAESEARHSQLSAAEGVRRARQPRFRMRALDLVIGAAASNEDEEMRVGRRSEAIANLAFPDMRQHALPDAEPGWSLATVSPGHEFYAWRGKTGWRVTSGRTDTLVSQAASQGKPLCLSRNGRWLAIALGDNRGWELWDLSKPEAKLNATRPGHPEDISDDGTLAAFYHQRQHADGTMVAQVCETATGRTRFQLTFPQVSLKMRFNADASLCAVAPSSYLNESNFPYSVRLHRCTNGSVARVLSEGMTNCVWSMAWSRDGTLLAAGERGGAALIWNTTTGNPRHLLRGTGSDMWLMAFSEDGRHLATVSDDQILSVYDVTGGTPVARGYEWIPQGVPQMAWSAVNPHVFGPISIDGTNTLVRLDPGAFETFSAPDSHGRSLGIAISPDGHWLAVGDSRHARLWNLRGEKRESRTFAPGLWNDFAFSPDGLWLYGAGEPGVVRWEMNAEGIVESTRHALLPAGRHNTVALDASGALLVAEAAGTGKAGMVQSPADAKPVRRDVPCTRNNAWVTVTQDGRFMAAASASGVEVTRITTGKKLHGQKKPALWAAFSPDGQWLVIGRERYEIWRTADWKLAQVLDMRTIDPAQARASFTPDGRWLATAHPFGKISLWSVPEWRRVAILESPNGQPVGRFAFSRDLTRLCIASTSGVIETWDLQKLQADLKKRGLEW